MTKRINFFVFVLVAFLLRTTIVDALNNAGGLVNLKSSSTTDLLSVIDLKSIKFPSKDVPAEDLVNWKSIKMVPSIEIPSVDLKAIELPSINVPSVVDFDLKSIGSSTGLPVEAVLPVVGVAGIAALIIAAASLQSGQGDTRTQGRVKGKSTKRRGGPDLSIPYDAAASIAYGEWLAKNDKAEFKAEAYLYFKRLHEAKAVADSTSKKLERDLAAFKNEAPPIPERKVISVTPEESRSPKSSRLPFFFASEKN
jgi:hypothetical protein